MTALERDTVRPRESLSSALHARAHHEPLTHERLDSSRLLGDRLGDRPVPFIPISDAIEDPGCDRSANAASLPVRIVDPQDPAREALERTCLTVKRIAHDIGMPRATLEAYRLGTRRMPQVARARLGKYLAAHAAMLDDLARALIGPTPTSNE